MSTPQEEVKLPRTARGRATRARIVHAATDLISKQGVAATSLDDVREAAQVSKSQLYLYFHDRDALLREVAGATCDSVLANQADVLAGFDSLAGVRRYLDAVVSLQAEPSSPAGCPIATLAGQLAEQDEQSRLILQDGFARWEQGFHIGLQAMAQRGELRANADPALLANQVLALVQGGLLLTQVRHDVGQIRLAADAALGLVTAAVVAS